MPSFGELFPGRKLKHEGDDGTPGREHDPGGPLDLDRGVVYLAPPQQQAEQGGADQGQGSASGERDSGRSAEPDDSDS